MPNAARVRNTVTPICLGLLGIAAVTLIGYRLHIDSLIAAFLYLMVVVLQAYRGDLASSVVASLFAVVCLDYFFTPPVFELEIASTVDAVGLATYLLTSLFIVRLVSDARQKARTAERKQEALARLYETTRRLFAVEPQSSSAASTLTIFRDVLDLKTVCLFDGAQGKMETAGEVNESLEDQTRQAYDFGRGREEPSGTWIRELQVGGHCTGALGFQGLSDAETLAAPLSLLAGAMLERAQSFQAASTAAAASQAETLRSAIVDAFAHQFKTPLAAILAAAGGIRETRRLTRPQFEMVDMIEVEALRLSRLATRLLVTARLDRDEVQPRLAPTNLNDLIARIVEECTAEARRVSVVLSSSPIEVASDRELLTLAVAQLLDNALKYSPSRNVRISVASKDSMACVRVKNQGSFIPPGERERIFERFYRGAATMGVTSGNGLGLYVARKIVHAHSGTLELERYTEPDAETIFCLTLPVLSTESQTCPQSRLA